MARTASDMVPLGTPAPEFTLPDTTAGGADVSLSRAYRQRGLAAVTISSHDTRTKPSYTFPYLHDNGRKHRATYTPTLFLYDRGRRLTYRGQLRDYCLAASRPVTGAGLRLAVEPVLGAQPVPAKQKPSALDNLYTFHNPPICTSTRSPNK